jgi:hypothetical protein
MPVLALFRSRTVYPVFRVHEPNSTVLSVPFVYSRLTIDQELAAVAGPCIQANAKVLLPGTGQCVLNSTLTGLNPQR